MNAVKKPPLYYSLIKKAAANLAKSATDEKSPPVAGEKSPPAAGNSQKVGSEERCRTGGAFTSRPAPRA